MQPPTSGEVHYRPSSAERPLLVVDRVSKRYEIYDRPEDRLKQSIIPRLQAVLPARFRRVGPYFRDFWALKDVSFTLERGEALGLLGRNGAGKSTLLQVIAGTLTPTTGTVDVSGKVAALLELGSGFSPEFTGRENVRMNASLLGLASDEIDDRFSEIAAFADIGDFIDQPVKTYSSGMMLRLAFAVQTAVEPEVLIVDEALAVGDAKFQKKCFARLEQLQKSGTTILLVTHDTGTVVQFCDRAMILEGGSIYAEGEPKWIAREYHKLLFGTPGKQEASNNDGLRASQSTEPVVRARGLSRPQASSEHEVRYGSGEAEVVAIGLRDSHGIDTAVLETHTCCEAYFHAWFPAPLDNGIAYGFIISNSRGVEIYGTKSGLFSAFIEARKAGSCFECRMRFVVRLVPGRYFLSVALAHDDEREQGAFLDYRFDALEFQVVGPIRTFNTSLIDLDATVSHTPLNR